MYAVIYFYEGPRYGKIVSVHETIDDAERACQAECDTVADRYPNALTHLMFGVEPLPTPAGDTGSVGDRVAVDLSR